MKKLLAIILSFVPTVLIADPVVSLAGLQIVFDDAEKEFDGFRTFNMEKGHRVALLLRSSEKMMVNFDEEKASVTIGGAKAESAFFMNNGSFSKDRKTLKLEFNANDKIQVNAEGKIEIKGELPLAFATGKGEIRSQPFQVKEGTKIVFTDDTKGLPSLEVKKADKPKWGDEALEIELSTDKKMDEYAGISFLTKDGKKIESRQTGSSWMTFIGKTSGSVTLALTDKHEELILVLETWTGREEKNISIDLKAGMLND